MTALRVVVTRPAPDGERTAEALRARGHDVVLAPLMRVEPLAADLAGDFAAVIITSANAPRAITRDPRAAALKSLPVYAVGKRSADAAREAGFTNVASADGDARVLLRFIGSKPPGLLLYLAGENRAADLAGALGRIGNAVKTAVVYRAVNNAFTAELVDALTRGQVDAVLHFSQRSAANYLAGAKAAGLFSQALSPSHFCMSGRIAKAIAAAGATSVHVAARPDENSMLELLGTA